MTHNKVSSSIVDFPVDSLKLDSCKISESIAGFHEAENYFASLLSHDDSLVWSEPHIAQLADQQDPLSHLREEFHIPRHPCDQSKEATYLCGNSLGCQPKATASLMTQDLQVWANSAVLGHTQHQYSRPWVSIDYLCDDSLATIVGAKTSEIGMMNSLSVNLQLLLQMFYKPTESKYKILMESNAFPSDHYVIQSLVHVVIKLLSAPWKFEDAIAFIPGVDPLSSTLPYGQQEAQIPRPDLSIYRTNDILKYIDDHGDSIALLLLPGVQYLTGQLFDMKSITAKAHSKGIVVGFDLAHAVGNVPLSLHDWDVDFAAWCSYKYLNAGPGAIGGYFLHEKYHENVLDVQPFLTGWWGNTPSNRFQMSPKYTMIKGAKKLQLSNPSVFSIIPLYASLEVFKKTSIPEIYKKSRRLVYYCRKLIHELIQDQESLTILTPIHESGAQLSMAFILSRQCEPSTSQGQAVGNHQPGQFKLADIVAKFSKEGIIVDEREPCVIRIAPTGLYNTYSEVFRFVEAVKAVLAELL